MSNVDIKTVSGFGDEWARMDQSSLSPEEREKIFNLYFSQFPWGTASRLKQGFDLGCGSGRWAKLVAPKVGLLHLIDASEQALAVAKRNLAGANNCEFHHASVDAIPLKDNSMDFGYSLGVLHHVPNTQAGIRSCVNKLKPGSPFLLYLYYAFDNRPFWFRWIWQLSEFLRQIVSRLPYGLRYFFSQLVAAVIYWPMARLSQAMKSVGVKVEHWPLSFYNDKSFYTMRTDALDRFGTRLEQRFSRQEITAMMTAAGLEQIQFNEHSPYWVAIGYKR